MVRIMNLKITIITQFFFLFFSLSAAGTSPKAEVVKYPAAKAGTVKTYKVAILMINTLSKPLVENPKTAQLEVYSAEKLGDIFFKHEHGARAFIAEASYGKVALEGVVVGWLNDPKPGLNADEVTKNADYYISLAKDYIKFSEFDIFIVHALVEEGGAQIGWLYPQQTFNSPQGKISNVGITWMVNSEVFETAPLLDSKWSSGESVLPTTSWSHELLHTFGITGHANSFDSDKKILDLEGSGNPLKAYCNPFSIMGEYAFGTHPDALMKSRISWITKEQIPEIKKSGSYEIYPLEVNDNQIKALTIPLKNTIKLSKSGAEFDAIIVEYRTATGFNRYMERLKGSPFLSQYTTLKNIDTNGVLVYLRYKSTDTDATALLDMNPETAFNDKRGIKIPGNVGKFADAILTVNKTFQWDNIHIMPEGVTKAGAMKVKVTIGAPAKR